jgi:hypothetical protein
MIRVSVKRTTNRYAEVRARTRIVAALINLDAAETARESALIHVPRDTGNLAETIKAEADGKGGAVYSAGGAKAPYAEAVESAQPFYTIGQEAGRNEIKTNAALRMRRLK